MSIPTKLSPNLLEASLGYLMPEDPETLQLAQYLKSLRTALRHQNKSPSIVEPAELISSKAFLYALIQVAYLHSNVLLQRHAATYLTHTAAQHSLTRYQLESQLV